MGPSSGRSGGRAVFGPLSCGHITVPMTAREAPQAMARRMSTRAGMRSGEQLTSEDAFEATAGEKAEDAAEATPYEKAEDAEATADEKAEATAVGLGTAAAQWPKAGMQTRSSHRKAPSAFV